MATYNGEAWLLEQINSIRKQSYEEWKLVIRDDDSDDYSQNIIRQICREDKRIILLNNNSENLGAAGSFSALLEMESSDTSYVMFADQDDVWYRDKIKKSLFEIRRLEENYGTETPLLVHTDLTVTDKNLNVICPSYWRYQNIDPERTTLSQLLMQNVITGCTIIINKALRDIAIPVPQEVIMHDWWLALVASLFGHVEYLDEQSIFYRQHGSNDVGAKPWNFRYIQKRFGEGKQIRSQLLKYQIQAKCLLERFGDKLNTEQLQILLDVANLNSFGKIKRVKTILKHGLYKNGVVRNIGSFLHI